jgi:hypothetical protein
LIVAVSVFSSLLLLIVIGTPLLWFLWLRFKIKGYSRKSSDASTKTVEQVLPVEATSSAVVDVVVENESRGSTRSDAEIMGIQIEGATEGE